MNDEEKALKEALVASHGNILELSRRLGVTREVADLRVDKAGLKVVAAKLRAKHGVSGNRSALELGSPNAVVEKKKIEGALREYGSQVAAAKALGIGRTRLQRAMQRLGIPA